MSNRWPLHPTPYLNESLSSWIARIANIYHIYFEDFLMNEFGINYESNSSYYIDLDPPLSLLTKLSQKTGITFDAIRALTAQAYTPLLIDTLKVEETNSFSDYVNQFNIFPRKKRKHCYNDAFDLTMGNDWISWLDSKRFVNTFGCESCLKEDKEPYLRLYWRFPWMMTAHFINNC